MKKSLLLFSAVIVFALAGCASKDPAVGSYSADSHYSNALFGDMARRSAEYEGPLRKPVIVIHGFLGSHLVSRGSGETVWGQIHASDAIAGYTDEHLKLLALPMEIGKPLRSLHNDVAPAGLLTKFKVQLYRWQFEVNGYDRLIDTLKSIGYQPDIEPLQPGRNYHTLFTFSYDWRRDIPENALRLDRFIRQCRTYLQKAYSEQYGLQDYDIKFDLIGHSMGGLLSRYYLRYGTQDLPADGSLPTLDWRGCRHVDRLILAGTPNLGYLDTCMELIGGLHYASGATPYPPGIIGTFHTYYQMMPPHSSRSVVRSEKDPAALDMFDLKTWQTYQWGLLAPDQDRYLKLLLPNAATREERLQIAADHLEKCLNRARHFQAAMRVPAELPPNLAMILFLGDSVETSRRAAVGGDGKLKVIEYDAGDGKVLAISARGDERFGRVPWVPYEMLPEAWDAVIHLPAAHMAIIRHDIFRDNVSYILLSSPGKGRRAQILERLKLMN